VQSHSNFILVATDKPLFQIHRSLSDPGNHVVLVLPLHFAALVSVSAEIQFRENILATQGRMCRGTILCATRLKKLG
jgi:hypothetical protein